MYTFQSKVRYSELDPERKLSIASIVDYFQDCSTFHSEQLGVGIDYLQEKNRVWVLSSWQIVVDRYPKLCEKIKITTWPYKGERIIRANSIWSLMDLKAGRPARPTEEMVKAYVPEPKLPMDYEPRKISLEGEGRKMPSFTVGKQHLDSNHHVNNGQYIYMAQDYLPEGFSIGQMRAEYRKSALLHDCIVPEVFEQEDTLKVSLCDGAGQPYAVVEFRKQKQ